ncbi:hypothetical protein GCM10022226_13140 [Sphaerisporangium flaviroseum]|uniref:Uncharacterized protein n=1 Tax=Sphaerisporangium flaviroseum TaxID=509199 RepID=A0ABP7HHP4_9ACTN
MLILQLEIRGFVTHLDGHAGPFPTEDVQKMNERPRAHIILPYGLCQPYGRGSESKSSSGGPWD